MQDTVWRPLLLAHIVCDRGIPSNCTVHETCHHAKVQYLWQPLTNRLDFFYQHASSVCKLHSGYPAASLDLRFQRHGSRTQLRMICNPTIRKGESKSDLQDLDRKCMHGAVNVMEAHCFNSICHLDHGWGSSLRSWGMVCTHLEQQALALQYAVSQRGPDVLLPWLHSPCGSVPALCLQQASLLASSSPLLQDACMEGSCS